MTPSVRPLAALVLLVALAGCDSADEAPLAPGTFRATASGDVDGRYTGPAGFGDLETPFDTVLQVRLKTGEYRTPGRDGAIATGISLLVRWSRTPGIYAVESQRVGGGGSLLLASRQSSGVPIPYRIESGSVRVSAVSAARVEGTFDVEAQDQTAAFGEVRTARVRGTFVADLSPDLCDPGRC